MQTIKEFIAYSLLLSSPNFEHNAVKNTIQFRDVGSKCASSSAAADDDTRSVRTAVRAQAHCTGKGKAKDR